MENGLNALFTQPKVTTKTSLWQLLDDKSIESCQQTRGKLIVKTSTNLQMTSCNKPHLVQLDRSDKFVASLLTSRYVNLTI